MFPSVDKTVDKESMRGVAEIAKLLKESERRSSEARRIRNP
jgi:hypothetical protein